MSLKIMSAIFETEFRDLPLSEGNGMAKASSIKLVMLAIADHANDHGESAYPGLTLLQRKTALSRQGLIDVINACKFNGLLSIDDEPSKIGTNNYLIDLGCYPCLSGKESENLLVKPLDYQEPELVKPLDQGSQATLPELVKPLDSNRHITIKEPPIADRKSKSKSATEKPDVDPRWDFTFKGDYTAYPQDVWEILIEFCLLWNFAAPRFSRKSKEGSTAVMWLNALRELQSTCGEFGIEALRDYHKYWTGYMQSHGGLAPFRVNSPKSLVNVMAGHVAAMRRGEKTEEWNNDPHDRLASSMRRLS